MKKLILFIGIAFLFSNCAFHKGLTTNSNIHSTEVVLSKKNFMVLENVSGEACATYVFGIGGLSQKALMQKARGRMIVNAHLVGGAKAIINETVDAKRSFFPIVQINKVTVSGQVVEFTE